MTWHCDEPQARMTCSEAKIVGDPKVLWEMDTREVALIRA